MIEEAAIARAQHDVHHAEVDLEFVRLGHAHVAFLFPEIVSSANCWLVPLPMAKSSQFCAFVAHVAVQDEEVCVYVIPWHHNPLGACYSKEVKARLISL